MAYYNSPKQYEIKTGREFTTDCPSIHKSGSKRGMEIFYSEWKYRDKVKYGNYIYLQPSKN